MPQPQLQQGSYVPPPLHSFDAAPQQQYYAPIQAQAMQPYQAPLAQAQYMQPPLQQGSYVPPPMDMGMQMPAPMAMPAPAMPVQAVPAQMSHVPMGAPFMQGMPPAMPEGFHAPPMGMPHEFAGHEALPQHEANPFLMGAGGMPGMPGGGMPGMPMPHGMAGMAMPHQVMGAHPAMGGPPVAGFGGAE